MYSVVLMMALSGGGEAVDFGHRNACRGGGGGGCSGYVGAGYGAPGCSGYAGAGYGGGCYGGGGHACSGRSRGHGHHGMRGSCSGGGGLFSKHRNRCSGGGYGGGCYGSGYGGGCYGGGAVGTCYGSPYGGAGCFGGGVVVPPGTTYPMGETPKAMPKEIKKTSISVPATIVVSLPAAATLTVDGNPTTSTSAVRTLVTPALESDSTYIYTLQVQVNGQTQTQQIQVRGGQTTQAQFSFPQGVASR
jgi:uncharacterized protein (TIGR03000 family)